MKFVCDRCQTKYAIADEKVRGRILKVRCKNCSNIVVVKESASAPVAAGGGESERTVISSRPHVSGIFGTTAAAAPAAKPRPIPAAAPAPPPAPEDDVQWFLALDGVQKGPFPRRMLVDRILALPRDADVHVWNENLDGWKPPRQVPVVARDLQARQRAVAPPVPPPPPRPRAVPPPPSRAANHGANHAANHATTRSPSGLPSPTGSLGLSGASAGMVDGLEAPDETPPPIHDNSRTHRAKNGVDAYNNGAPTDVEAVPAALIASRANGDSDALIALNLGGAWRNPAGAVAGAAPELLSAPVVASVPGRQRSLRLVAAFIGIVGVCVVVLFNFVLVKKPPPAAPPVDRSKTSAGPDDGFAAMADKLAKESAASKLGGKEPGLAPSNPPPAPPSVATVEPSGRSGGHKSGHGKNGRNGGGSTGDTTPPPLAPLTAEQQAAAARFGDTSHRTVQVRTAGGSGARSTPEPGEISRVVNANKGGIKVCYQRALLRDSSLTHGKVTVRVSIGLSGRVKDVNVDGPAAFRVVDPCIKEVLSHWVFPASSEEYGTEFSSVFQGNE